MSSVNSVSANPATSKTGVSTISKKETSTENVTKKNASSFADTAAVYEKSGDSKVSEKDSKTASKAADHSAIVKQLKADADARARQLMEIVQKSLSQQAKTWDRSMGLAKAFENLQVSDDVIAQAKRDVAEDGYWGVEQTSDRILDFAKALSGGDSSKASELLDAFKKGYEKATKAWGQDLPDISQKTFAAVEEKFKKWMDGE